MVESQDLPDDIWGFTDPKWRGRIGWAPTNGSFQAFVTALRALEGDRRAEEWLKGILANRPRVYNNNTAIVDAVGRGEVHVGFVNHYYLHRFLAEQGDSFPVRNFHTSGDAEADRQRGGSRYSRHEQGHGGRSAVCRVPPFT